MRLNKYSKLKSSPVSSLVPNDSPIVLHFKQADGRFQRIDLTFFTRGTHARPQVAKACSEVFWVDMQNDASDSRLNFKNDLRIFNTFLNWRVKGNPDKQLSTTLEIDSSVFIEYQAYLAAAMLDGQTTEQTAASRYHRVTRFFSRMQIVRPQYLLKGLKIPANPFFCPHRGGLKPSP